jgi:hypothetical protein
MDLRRLRAGEWILALSGVVLLVSLFLPWYRPSLTAWEALAVNDVILAIVGLAALAALVATATQRVPAVPIALEAMVAALGVVALLLVVVRAIWLPDAADQRDYGLWIGLAGAVGMAVGGWIAIRDERMPAAPKRPEHDPLPAPPP